MPRARAASQLGEYRRKRDFRLTAEPRGDEGSAAAGKLRFVIQKHAASHLHYDLRLELDGVMKSWAVPKGPSNEPGDKRLAMQVEDHPIEYNAFEGTIPRGEYGGGTVMLWDVGTYAVDGADGDDESVMAERYRKGDVKVTFHGERMRGSYSLVRMRPKEPAAKPAWLLIKHRDQHAGDGNLTGQYTTSVVTGRTMEEIGGDENSAVWHSNREPGTMKKSKGIRLPSSLPGPMLATTGKEIPTGDWTFETKYDGVRVLAYCTREETRLITRNGLDKSQQFPEIAAALSKVAGSARRALVLDGEIIALTRNTPARFQQLQSRMHVQDRAAIKRYSETSPAAIAVFDILMDGDEPLVHEPWTTRRERLEKRLAKRTSDRVILTDTHPRDGEKLLDRARSRGWEGVIAKRMDSRYEAGVRSRSWLKLKTEHQQEFVVGGWTEPRQSRQHIGAILLGYYDDGQFVYAGHTGGGFSQKSLAEVYELLAPLERESSPFTTTPKTNERPHWTEPEVVVEVRFNEWTADGKLRQPIFLGLRADKNPRDVKREAESVQKEQPSRRSARKSVAAARAARVGKSRARAGAVRRRARTADRTTANASKRRTTAAAAARRPKAAVSASTKQSSRGASRATKEARPERGTFPSRHAIGRLVTKREAKTVLQQLDTLCASERRGVIQFGRGRELSVTNLDKVFFKREGYTKGDLLRYYTIVADLILPTVTDRPLVLRRFPNGIDGQAFYQQKAQPETPEDVRVETVTNDVDEKQRRMIGGDLLTLLYTIQLGAISVDPWHSRVGNLEYADYAVVDLDPGPHASFSRVVDVARWVREVLDDLGLSAGLKTSGATGLHVYIPLPPKTPNEAATLVAQMIATRVAEDHPRVATVVRWVKQRGASTVYVDYLQNIKGKTLAGPYCVRAKPGATVSTPLDWDELDNALDPREFTIVSAPERFARTGDIWKKAMQQRNSLERLITR